MARDCTHKTLHHYFICPLNFSEKSHWRKQPGEISDRLLKEVHRNIQQNLKGIRDNEMRRKAALLFTVLEAKNIPEGCRRAGLARNTFYDWTKKLKASKFNLLELNK